MVRKDWAKEQNLAEEPLTPKVPGPPSEACDGVIWTLMVLGSPTPPSMLPRARVTYLLIWLCKLPVGSTSLGRHCNLRFAFQLLVPVTHRGLFR